MNIENTLKLMIDIISEKKFISLKTIDISSISSFSDYSYPSFYEHFTYSCTRRRTRVVPSLRDSYRTQTQRKVHDWRRVCRNIYPYFADDCGKSQRHLALVGVYVIESSSSI